MKAGRNCPWGKAKTPILRWELYTKVTIFRLTETPKRGRPVEKPMPALIPDTPENVAFALVSTPPKGEDEWGYLKENKG